MRLTSIKAFRKPESRMTWSEKLSTFVWPDNFEHSQPDECDVILTLEDHENDIYLRIVDGGITGHETVKLVSIIAGLIENDKGNWIANFGTPGRWDRLEVPLVNIEQSLISAGVIDSYWRDQINTKLTKYGNAKLLIRRPVQLNEVEDAVEIVEIEDELEIKPTKTILEEAFEILDKPVGSIAAPPKVSPTCPDHPEAVVNRKVLSTNDGGGYMIQKLEHRCQACGKLIGITTEALEEHPLEEWFRMEVGYTFAEASPRMQGYLSHCWNHAVRLCRREDLIFKDS